MILHWWAHSVWIYMRLRWTTESDMICWVLAQSAALKLMLPLIQSWVFFYLHLQMEVDLWEMMGNNNKRSVSQNVNSPSVPLTWIVWRINNQKCFTQLHNVDGRLVMAQEKHRYTAYVIYNRHVFTLYVVKWQQHLNNKRIIKHKTQ